MEGDGIWQYTVKVDKASDQNILVVQLHDEASAVKWINAGSYGVGFGDVAVTGGITANYDAVKAGSTWTVTIQRVGDKITIEYYNMTDSTEFVTYSVDASKLEGSVYARIAAQYGTYTTDFAQLA